MAKKTRKDKRNYKQIRFETFRFQILPIDNAYILDFGDTRLNYNQLVSQKNDLFAEVLDNLFFDFEHPNVKADIYFRLQRRFDSLFIFRLAIKRKLTRNTRDFDIEDIENFPNVYVIIDNNPENQKIAIQVNYDAFEKVETVANILEHNFSRYLQRYNLAIYIESIFSKQDFWDIVERYPNRITQVTFDLVRPNLGKISKKIGEQIKELQLSLNSHRTKIEISSNKDSVLKIEPTNQQINNLVDYSSKGGGPISVKIKGLTKKVQTTKATEEFHLNELEIRADNPSHITSVIKKFLDK